MTDRIGRHRGLRFVQRGPGACSSSGCSPASCSLLHLDHPLCSTNALVLFACGVDRSSFALRVFCFLACGIALCLRSGIAAGLSGTYHVPLSQILHHLGGHSLRNRSAPIASPRRPPPPPAPSPACSAIEACRGCWHRTRCEGESGRCPLTAARIEPQRRQACRVVVQPTAAPNPASLPGQRRCRHC
jgi:hypothetical protein